jgi:hypothetical protein
MYKLQLQFLAILLGFTGNAIMGEGWGEAGVGFKAAMMLRLNSTYRLSTKVDVNFFSRKGDLALASALIDEYGPLINLLSKRFDNLCWWEGSHMCRMENKRIGCKGKMESMFLIYFDFFFAREIKMEHICNL